MWRDGMAEVHPLPSLHLEFEVEGDCTLLVHCREELPGWGAKSFHLTVQPLDGRIVEVSDQEEGTNSEHHRFCMNRLLALLNQSRHFPLSLHLVVEGLDRMEVHSPLQPYYGGESPQQQPTDEGGPSFLHRQRESSEGNW